MQRTMQKLGVVLMCAVIAACVGVWVPPAFAHKALVERTGQVASIAEGDDGDIQAGVPFPTPRFVDKGNGTVRDKLTGLIWLKNADCFGSVEWAQALLNANTLAHGSCGLTDGSEAGDWRLPNIKELHSLIDFGQSDPALPLGHPFSDVHSAFYLSSTTDTSDVGFTWIVHLGSGLITGLERGSTRPMWPVRGGIIKETPE